MIIEYTPKGVCSRKMIISIENNIVRSVQIEGGCSGNLQGISRLVEGMQADEAIRKLEGIRCGWKDTSCPDQLSKALKQYYK